MPASCNIWLISRLISADVFLDSRSHFLFFVCLVNLYCGQNIHWLPIFYMSSDYWLLVHLCSSEDLIFNLVHFYFSLTVLGFQLCSFLGWAATEIFTEYFSFAIAGFIKLPAVLPCTQVVLPSINDEVNLTFRFEGLLLCGSLHSHMSSSLIVHMLCQHQNLSCDTWHQECDYPEGGVLSGQKI